eukprot:TRINITY_DN5232_c1_g3_i1.p1 TRINITY_DN5232_c1_g3~~TRINITY_DN5232_c1_g3_i1.p1  ORF type:complete len:432 (+),score=76.34 TRINITY_DN5232_c1_g3_i1:58-1296(+)
MEQLDAFSDDILRREICPKLIALREEDKINISRLQLEIKQLKMEADKSNSMVLILRGELEKKVSKISTLKEELTLKTKLLETSRGEYKSMLLINSELEGSLRDALRMINESKEKSFKDEAKALQDKEAEVFARWKKQCTSIESQLKDTSALNEDLLSNIELLLIQSFPSHGTFKNQDLVSQVAVMFQNLTSIIDSSRKQMNRRECCVCTSKISPDAECLYLECNHLHCMECIRNRASSQKANRDYYLKCSICNTLIPDDLYFLFLDQDSVNEIRLAQVRQLHSNVQCPFPNCGCDFYYDGDGIAVECGECNRIFCFECKTPWHFELTCRQNQKLADELPPNIKKCPKCKTLIEKNGGCRTMFCKYLCQSYFCWVCREGMFETEKECENHIVQLHGALFTEEELFQEDTANPI